MPPSVSTSATSIRLGGGELDLDRAVIRRPEGDVALTATEVDLLRHFLERPGVVFDRAELLRKVWGYRAGVVSRAVDHAVKRLRAKIEADRSQPLHLLTVTGRGYRFVLPVGVLAPAPSTPSESLPQRPAVDLPRPTVDAWLDGPGRAPGIVAVTAPPGSGKSHAVLVWAHREQDRGRPVVWVRWGGQTAARSLWTATTDALHAAGIAADSALPLLVVWDDLDAVDASELLASAAECGHRLSSATLLLTRSTLPSSDVVSRLDLPRLTEDEAVRLLNLRAGQLAAASAAPDIGALLSEADHRPRAIEELAPFFQLFPVPILIEKMRASELPSSPVAGQSGLRHRSTTASSQAIWAQLSETEQAVFSQLLVFPDAFQPADLDRTVTLSDPPVAGDHLLPLLSLRDAQAVRSVATEAGWLEVDPLLRRWWIAHAPEAARTHRKRARARRAQVLVEAELPVDHELHPAHQAELVRMTELAAKDGDGELVARLLFQCGGRWRRRGDAERLAVVMRTLEAHPPTARATRARLACFRAEWLIHIGDRSGAIAASTEALDLTDGLEDAALRSLVCRGMGNMGHRLPLPRPALSLLEEAVTWGRRTPQRVHLANALSSRSGKFIDAGRHAEAEADLIEAIGLFEQLDAPASAARCRGRMATLRKHAGRYEESLVLFEAATEQMSDRGRAYDRANIRMNHANLLADLGRLTEATRLYEGAIEICLQGGEAPFAASVRGSLATVLAEQERYDEARLVFTEAIRVHRLNGSAKQAAYCALGLATLAMDTGDLASTSDILQDLDRSIAQLAVPELTVAHGIQLAVWMTRSGDTDGAWTQLAACESTMAECRLRDQHQNLCFAKGLTAVRAGQTEMARGHAAELRRELTRLCIGPSSVLWRRLAEVEDALATSTPATASDERAERRVSAVVGSD